MNVRVAEVMHKLVASGLMGGEARGSSFGSEFRAPNSAIAPSSLVGLGALRARTCPRCGVRLCRDDSAGTCWECLPGPQGDGYGAGTYTEELNRKGTGKRLETRNAELGVRS